MVETFLYAIFVVSIAVSSSILIRRGLHNPANKAMFIITIMMFVLSTICWACGIRLLWNDLAAITLSDSPDAPNHPCLVNTGSVNGPLKFLAYISNDICTVMSDGVVAWRAWIVCRKDRRFAILAAILFTGLLVAGILGELASLTIYFPGLIDILPLVDRYLKFSATWFFISTTINVMSTGLIAYRTWCHRKYVCKFLNDESKKRFEVGRVLMLVVDTGIVYTLFWIFIAVSKIMEYANAGSHVFITGPLRFFSEALQYQVTGLYPTVIIILVSLQKSQLENQFTYTGANAAPEIANLSESAPRMPQAFTASQVMTGSSEHAAFHHSSDREALSSDIGEAAGDKYEELKDIEEIV